jgi:hypothetical protein
MVLGAGGLEDPRLRLPRESGSVLTGGPDVRVQEAEKSFRLSDGVEVEVDDHISRVIDGSLDALLPNPSLPTDIGEPRERRVPGIEVGDGMFDLQGCHGNSLVRMDGVLMLRATGLRGRRAGQLSPARMRVCR